MLGAIRNLFAPAYQREAEKLVQEAERSQDSPTGVLDRYAAQHGQVPEARPLIELTRAALEATPWEEEKRKVVGAGLTALSQGAQPTSDYLAGLAVELLKASENNDAVAQALAGPIARRYATEAEVLTTLAQSAQPEGSKATSLAAAFATLSAAGAGLPALAAAGGTGVLSKLSGNPVAEMAESAAEGAHYGSTQTFIRESALEKLDRSNPADMARLAQRWLENAYAGQDDGKWRDEKTPVASRTLKSLAGVVTRDEDRQIIELAQAALSATTFTKSNVAIAEHALEFIASQNEGKSKAVAIAVERMVNGCINGKSGDVYHDDQHAVTRATMAILKNSTDPVVADLAQLTEAALSPTLYSSSALNAAQAGFNAMIQGENDGRALARTARKMIEGALNQNNKDGQWQPDKSRIWNAVLPVLKEKLGPETALDMCEAALDDPHFSPTIDGVATEVLLAIEGGDLRAKELGRLANRMVEVAHISQSGEYRDDQSKVARGCARALSELHGDAGEYAKMAAEVLSKTRFTDSNVAVARAAFDAIRSGQQADLEGLARVGHQMLEGARNQKSSEGEFLADKSQVGFKVRRFLQERVESGSPAEATLALWEGALDDTTFATTGEAIAQIALNDLKSGGTAAGDLGRRAAAMVEAATVSTDPEGDRHDDQSAAARGLRASLSQVLTNPGDQRLLDLIQQSLDDTTFTDSHLAIAKVAYPALGGDGSTAQLAEVGLRMVEQTLASKNVKGDYIDDKTPVARATLKAVMAHPEVSKDEALVVKLGLAAINGSRFTDSCVACGNLTLRAIKKNDTASTAEFAEALIRAGTVTSGKQDQGPIATELFAALAQHASDGPRKTRHLVMSGMMNTGADYRQRVEVAARALKLWERDEVLPSSEMAARVLSEVSSQDDRLKMLHGAVKALQEVSDYLVPAGLDQLGEDELRELLDKMAPSTEDEVRALTELTEDHREIKIDEDSVWVGDFNVPIDQ